MILPFKTTRGRNPLNEWVQIWRSGGEITSHEARNFLPEKSAAPSQAECAEQRPKVTQVGGVTKREYCATAPLIVAFPPQSQRAIAFCTSSERCAASCLPPCYTPFFLPMHISILHVRRAKQGAERGREGGRTGGHLSESAASLAQATDATPPSALQSASSCKH